MKEIPIISNLKVNLNGRVALVTGAAKGIGRIIALSLALDGADLVLVDIDENALVGVVNEVKSLGRDVLPLKADVTKWSEVANAVEESIKKYGHIDILVNNAGIVGTFKNIEDLSEEEWDKVIETNLKGTFLFTKAVVPYMKKQKYGRIVNMASVAGVEGNARMSHYSASKAGIIGLTKALAEELAPYGIRVNAVAPALVEGTALTESMSPEQREFLAKKIPLGRLCKPHEVADLVKFLVSDASEFITGYVYILAGGRARCT
ncbi:MAG: SDR family NAD(P)-dependent oxidoreductase [Ignisphaera sp.]